MIQNFKISAIYYAHQNKIQLNFISFFIFQHNQHKISDGEIPLQQDKDQFASRVLGYLQQGQTFGELNFFTGLGRSATIKSHSFTRILKISRDQFLEIIKHNDKDLERYCEIRDKISFNSDYTDLNLSCQICSKSDHLSNYCPNAHFNKKSPFLFARINHSHSQIRDENYDRKRQRYMQFFQKFENVKAQARKAQIDLLSDSDDEDDHLDEEFYDADSQQYDDDKSSKKSEVINSKINNNELKPQTVEQTAQGIHQDHEKSCSSIIINLENKQDENCNRRQSNTQKDDIMNQQKIESYNEYKKKSIRVSLAIQSGFNYIQNLIQFKKIDDNNNRRQSHMHLKEDLQSSRDIQQQDLQRRKSKLYHQKNLVQFQQLEKQQTLHQQFMNNNHYSQQFTTTFSKQINKANYSYTHYNKTDEIIKDILLWNLDKMKTFNYYFPNSNFKFVINKYLIFRKKFITQKSCKERSLNKLKPGTVVTPINALKPPNASKAGNVLNSTSILKKLKRNFKKFQDQ